MPMPQKHALCVLCLLKIEFEPKTFGRIWPIRKSHNHTDFPVTISCVCCLCAYEDAYADYGCCQCLPMMYSKGKLPDAVISRFHHPFCLCCRHWAGSDRSHDQCRHYHVRVILCLAAGCLCNLFCKLSHWRRHSTHSPCWSGMGWFCSHAMHCRQLTSSVVSGNCYIQSTASSQACWG